MKFMKKETLPIGNLITQELDRQDRSIAWLSVKVGRDHGSLCDILKRDHIDTIVISAASKALRYDFFAHYSAFLKELSPDVVVEALVEIPKAFIGEVEKKKNVLIGTLIRQKLKEQKRSIAWLGRKLKERELPPVVRLNRMSDSTCSTLRKALKREHLDSTLLLNISIILRYDFFGYYSAFFARG
jgi:hypothetical protein